MSNEKESIWRNSICDDCNEINIEESPACKECFKAPVKMLKQEIEKLKKEKELILTNLNNVYEHYKLFKDEKQLKAGMKGIIEIWSEGL